MTVLIAALNMQWEASAGAHAACLMIWLNIPGQRTCPFRASASGPRNQTSVRSPASWQESDTWWARQRPDKWGWRLSGNIWPPLPNSWIKHWPGIKLKAVHKETTTFPTPPVPLQWIHALFKGIQIKGGLHCDGMMLSKDEDNVVAEGNWGEIAACGFFSVKNT